MLPDNPKPTPLIGDPARQAPDLSKGLVYQIWRSVEAWISLEDDELLFLEGAEDYDVVSSTSGTAVQVKATVGNITLRSEAVISALNSFWLIKNNHQDKQIWLRFITTSLITTEQGNPFGDNAKGLEVWMQCAETKDTSPLIPMTRSRPLARPSRAFAFGKFLSSFPQTTQVPGRSGEDKSVFIRVHPWLDFHLNFTSARVAA